MLLTTVLVKSTTQLTETVIYTTRYN